MRPLTKIEIWIERIYFIVAIIFLLWVFFKQIILYTIITIYSMAKKKKGIKEEKAIVLNMTFEEAMKKALSTPLLKKSKKKAK